MISVFLQSASQIKHISQAGPGLRSEKKKLPGFLHHSTHNTWKVNLHGRQTGFHLFRVGTITILSAPDRCNSMIPGLKDVNPWKYVHKRIQKLSFNGITELQIRKSSLKPTQEKWALDYFGALIVPIYNTQLHSTLSLVDIHSHKAVMRLQPVPLTFGGTCVALTFGAN